MSGIDYSKWDKIVAEMSDSDEENETKNEIPDGAAMHDLMKFQDERLSDSVKSGSLPTSSNDNNELQDEKKKEEKDKEEKDKEEKDKEEILPIISKILPPIKSKKILPTISTSLSSLLSSWTHNGGMHHFEYLWSQTSDELVLRILVPSTTKGKHVKINFNAELQEFKCNVITNVNVNIYKKFAQRLQESDEEDANLDWELCNIPVFNYDNNNSKEVIKNILSLHDNDDKDNDKICNEFVLILSSCRFLKLSLEKEKKGWWEQIFGGDTKRVACLFIN